MTKHRRMTLPNGENIAVMNRSEADIIYREIFVDDIYSEGGLEIRDGDTVIDIGANIGLFMRYATSFGERVRVFSYEPIPDTFSVLNANTPGGRENVHLFNQGVSGEAGTAVFQHQPRFSCCSSMHPDNSPEQQERAEEFTLNILDKLENPVLSTAVGVLPKAGRRVLARAINHYYQKTVDIECRLTSVPDIIRDNDLEVIDYLKVDAEGAEVDILENIGDEHWQRIRQIAIETHFGEEILNRIVEIVKTKGYETEVGFSPMSPLDGMVYGRRA